MEKISQITTGKAKSLFTTNEPDQLIMEFRDDTSAFDGKKIEALDNKGKVNNQFNAFVMEFLASKGIETHFIKLLSNHESLVHKLEMFPIECVVRNRATGSLCKRLGIEDGLILDPPLFEFFLKDDDLEEALKIVESFDTDISLITWQCNQCLEDNDQTFDYCWKCNAENSQ